MNKIKYMLLLTAVTAVLSAVNVCAATEAEFASAAYESLTIPYAEDIRGNIHMPGEVKVTVDDEEATVDVVWTSSRPDIISDKDIPLDDIGIDAYKVIPAGVVTRQDEDVDVTLNATIVCEGTVLTKTFNVTVTAKPEEKVMEAYAFSSFPSNHEEQVYLSVGTDYLHFKDLNNSKPILVSDVGNNGIRDPYIVRSHEGDRFFLLSTDLCAETQGFETVVGSQYIVIWTSDDLVNWSDATLTDCGAIAYEKSTGYHLGCVYAPEAIYDELTGEYVIFWASRWYPSYYPDGNQSGRKYKIFYSRTRDFVHFDEAKLYIDYEGIGTGIIDTTMIKASDGKYYRISADGDMNIQTSDYVLGNWTYVSDITSLHKKMNGYDVFCEEYLDASGNILNLTGGRIEGPELFKINGEEKYGLYADNYQQPGFGYIPMVTTDLSDTTGSEWQLYSRNDYSWGTNRKRHGGILPITMDEYNRLVEHYGVED